MKKRKHIFAGIFQIFKSKQFVIEKKQREKLYSRMKYFRKIAGAALPFCYLAIMGIGLTSCTDEKDTMELGKQAAIEACECLDNGATMEECEEQLNKDYKYDVDDEFIEAFNEAGYCDIVINKK